MLQDADLAIDLARADLILDVGLFEVLDCDDRTAQLVNTHLHSAEGTLAQKLTQRVEGDGVEARRAVLTDGRL